MLLLKTDWKNKKEFLNLLKEHLLFKATTKEEFINKRNILYKAFKLIEMDIDEVDNGKII